MSDDIRNPDGSVVKVLSSEETSSSLLDQLLESSFSQKKRVLSEQEWSNLREIVKGAESKPMPFEELVVALVESFLLNRLTTTIKTKDALHSMSRTIARTLCSDPTSRQRLVEFQKQLIGIS